MVGRSRPRTPAKAAIVAFEPAGGAEVSDVPGGMTLVHGKVGDSGAEVGAEKVHGLGLGAAIVADDVAIALEHRGETLGLPDVMEVAENGFALAALFLAGEVFAADADGVVEVAQLVEEAALFGGAEVDAVEGRAEPGPAIMDNEFQAVGPAD